MFSSILIAFLALTAAVVIMAVAIHRHQRQDSMITTWRDVRDAFSGHPIRGVRDEAMVISDPEVLDTDMRVSDLLAQGRDGTGYIEPHDILGLRSGRN